jgi:hypothetical protein
MSDSLSRRDLFSRLLGGGLAWLGMQRAAAQQAPAAAAVPVPVPMPDPPALTSLTHESYCCMGTFVYDCYGGPVRGARMQDTEDLQSEPAPHSEPDTQWDSAADPPAPQSPEET